MVHRPRAASVWVSMVRASSMAQDYIAGEKIRLLFLAFVGADHAVANSDHAVRVLGDVVLVSDHDNGVPLRVQAVHEGHDLVAGFGVKVSGRLVSQDDG